MKLTNTLGQHAVQSTTTAKKMRLSDNATSRVFQLFTKNVYSDAMKSPLTALTAMLRQRSIHLSLSGKHMTLRLTLIQSPL